jgi:hypothetical protein
MISSRVKLIDNQSVPGVGAVFASPQSQEYAKSFHLIVVGVGTVSAVATIEVSNDGEHFISTPVGTISVSGTGSDSDGFLTQANWAFYRATLVSISGSQARATLWMAS